MKNFLSTTIYMAIAFIGVMTLHSCKSNVPAISECICIGPGLNGSVRLTAFGYGLNNAEAIIAAKKNAVQELLFKGIKASTNPGCPSRPIIDDISKRNSDYFNDFFKNNGAYLQFVNLSGDQTPTRVKVRNLIKVSIDVIVDHKRLHKQMVDDKQARGLNDGF